MWMAFLALVVALQPALADTPNAQICGDWDMGPNSTALRITTKDSNSLFVQFCDRNLLLTQYICDASVILYFTYSQSLNEYVHSGSGAQHLYATLQVNSQNPSILDYTFKSDVGSGSLTGKRIARQ